MEEGKRRSGGSKRNSGIFAQSGQAIQRRTSKKASSSDRHGHVYPEEFAERTLRAVTPESDRTESLREFISSPHPITPISTSSEERTLVGHRNGFSCQRVDISDRNTSGFAGHRVAQALSRPRTRTLEERIRDRSPTSKMAKTRSRLGSIPAPALPALGDSIQAHSSIGYPSIIPSPTSHLQSQNSRQRLSKKPPSQGLAPLVTSQSSARPTPYQSPTRDTTKILGLMKTTQGRMHGILSSRTTRAGAWSSGYCAINVGDGKLIYQNKGDTTLAKTLIPDLRGCKVRTMLERDTQQTFLRVSTRNNGLSIDLRPHVPETLDSWLAALLCWQPIASKGIQNKMIKPQATIVPERRPGSSRRRSSAMNISKDAAVVKTIKVSNMLYWDASKRSESHTNPTYRRISTYKQQRSTSSAWQQVSGSLQDNGQFQIFTKSDTRVVATIPLSSLSRCAIQRLDPSVLDDEFTIAIYPQYTSTNATMDLADMQPTYLSLESRVYFEVWFVLLRAFTIPELYGPESIPSDPELSPMSPMKEAPQQHVGDMLRMERYLFIRIIEAKLHTPRTADVETGVKSSPMGRSSSAQTWVPGDYYAEAKVDEEVRARTAIKTNTHNPFWREDYEFFDLPPVIGSAVIMLKSRNLEQRDWTLISDGPFNYESGDLNNEFSPGDIEISALDAEYGFVELRLDDLERGKDTEKWWPIRNDNDEVTGKLLMRLRTEDTTVLMSIEYQPLLELLCLFSNGLTQQVVSALPSETPRLSNIFLNIFQDSRHATDWIMSLIEEEIDGVHKGSLLSKYRYSRRAVSNDSYDSSAGRAVLVRDMGKSATVEANLLFRGNSLLTKSLELYMRRVGKEYLEETLGQSLRDIDESNPDCEVDPNRVGDEALLKRNWVNLIALTENLWQSIYNSVHRCPVELRIVCRHIRACAEDRYGDFMRNIRFSSVSGFLFLRFFVPAVLSPKLFNLLKDHPRPRATRTLTLIAKALQALANLNPLGTKEPWMTPMNDFLARHREEFKSFVDAICSVSSERTAATIPPAYATPITIAARLPPASREGFLSLPYLLDKSRELAILVALWGENRSKLGSLTNESDELKKFDVICTGLGNKTQHCLSMAETAERPSGVLEPRWEELVQQMNRKSSRRSLADSTLTDNEKGYNHSNSGDVSETIVESQVTKSFASTNSRGSNISRPATRSQSETMTNSVTYAGPSGGSSLSSSVNTGDSSPIHSTFGDSCLDHPRPQHLLPYISAADEDEPDEFPWTYNNHAPIQSSHRAMSHPSPPVRHMTNATPRQKFFANTSPSLTPEFRTQHNTTPSLPLQFHETPVSPTSITPSTHDATRPMESIPSTSSDTATNPASSRSSKTKNRDKDRDKSRKPMVSRYAFYQYDGMTSSPAAPSSSTTSSSLLVPSVSQPSVLPASSSTAGGSRTLGRNHRKGSGSVAGGLGASLGVLESQEITKREGDRGNATNGVESRRMSWGPKPGSSGVEGDAGGTGRWGLGLRWEGK